MKKHSKRIKEAYEKIKDEFYLPQEGITLVKQTATAKFAESAEVHISLNINPKYTDQQLRSTLILPKGTGKVKRIALLMPEEKILPHYSQLVNLVGSEDLIETMSKGQLDFDILVATPEMMPKLAKLGRILGPKGLMPSPKAGTVTNDIESTLNEFKKGKVEYRADRTGIVHLNFGKVDFSESDLLENLVAVYKSIEQNKPTGVKGRYFNTIFICSTMGPSIPIDLAGLKL